MYKVYTPSGKNLIETTKSFKTRRSYYRIPKSSKFTLSSLSVSFSGIAIKSSSIHLNYIF